MSQEGSNQSLGSSGGVSRSLSSESQPDNSRMNGSNSNGYTTGETNSEADPDPLEIRKLALSYDYLIYKINDHISNLADTTYESITTKQKLIEVNYLEDQLNLSQELTEIDQLLDQCNQLEMEFLKLDQLQIFINDFKNRIEVIEKGFQQLS
ncbi:hypothetical protein DFJ63DRAFT_334713 [Scheffersomyces coipomensis]|uniref:uncharacterized protein n=1 Tax=Scheffersomyces coipomensis TaxID=1788519 RepID=UPI00315C53F3